MLALDGGAIWWCSLLMPARIYAALSGPRIAGIEQKPPGPRARKPGGWQRDVVLIPMPPLSRSHCYIWCSKGDILAFFFSLFWLYMKDKIFYFNLDFAGFVEDSMVSKIRFVIKIRWFRWISFVIVLRRACKWFRLSFTWNSSAHIYIHSMYIYIYIVHLLLLKLVGKYIFSDLVN